MHGVLKCCKSQSWIQETFQFDELKVDQSQLSNMKKISISMEMTEQEVADMVMFLGHFDYTEIRERIRKSDDAGRVKNTVKKFCKNLTEQLSDKGFGE